MNKLGNIQSLRAIAAWSVVYYHYAHDYYGMKPESLILKLTLFYGNFGVDLFFVISGFIMYHSLRNRPVSGQEFLVRRCRRIIPAYWFFTMVLFLMTLSPVALFRVNVPWTSTSLLKSLCFISDSKPEGFASSPFLYVGWTLTYEFLFYLIITLWLMVSLRLATTFAMITMFVLPIFWPAQWPASGIFRDYRMYEFATGMLIGLFYRSVRPDLRISRLISIASLMAGGLCLLSRGPYYPVGRITAASLFIISGLFDRDFMRFRISGVLQNLGNISYSTYLVHPLVLMIFLNITGRDFHRFQEWLIIILLSLVTLLLSMISFRYVENGRCTIWKPRMFRG